jgi:hypothetical protein
MANYQSYQGDIKNLDAARLSHIDMRFSRAVSDGGMYDFNIKWKRMVIQEINILREKGVVVSIRGLETNL